VFESWQEETDFSLLHYIETGSAAVQSSCSMETRVPFQGMTWTTHKYQVPRLRMSGAIDLLSLYAFMAWTGTVLPCISYLVYLTCFLIR